MPEAIPNLPSAPTTPAPADPAAAAPEIAAGASPTEIDPKKLTPEEQLALFEKHLKENDWGHQPC